MHITRSYLLLGGTLAVSSHAVTNGLSSLVHSLGLSKDDLDTFSLLNSATPFNTTFASTPTPWQVCVSPHFIAITKLKVALTRFTTDIAIPPWIEGPPESAIIPVRNYWLRNYSWPTVQSQINVRFNHFTTTVHLSATNYTDPIPLHFVHHRSSHPNAIPLLFMHGTPGNFMEIHPLIKPLTDPPPGSPAFHVVAPSMPGYGFSLAPKKPGMDPTHTASAMNELMLQLNYPRYVAQAGDWGGIVLRYLAAQHPAHVVSALSNFFIVAPNATDLARYDANLTTPDETTYIRSILNYGDYNSGYRLLMGETPLQIVDAMTDSPLGNLAFEWTMMKWLSDPKYNWTLEELITWSMMYYIPGPYASMRHYREMALEGIHAGTRLGNVYPYITVPVGLSEWPGDFWYRLPLDWAQRYANVTFRVVHDTGAHFPALQNTDLFVQDIRNFFGNTTLSNTGPWLD